MHQNSNPNLNYNLKQIKKTKTLNEVRSLKQFKEKERKEKEKKKKKRKLVQTKIKIKVKIK